MRVIVYKTILDDDGKTTLVKDYATNYDTTDKSLTYPKSVADLANNVFDAENLAEEYMWLIAVNIKGKPIGVFEISHGTVSTSVLSTREIFTRLCLLGAVGFFVVHNHPSGNSSPSEEDISITENLKEASKILGVTLVDHIIIAREDGHFSFRENGYLE